MLEWNQHSFKNYIAIVHLVISLFSNTQLCTVVFKLCIGKAWSSNTFQRFFNEKIGNARQFA